MHTDGYIGAMDNLRYGIIGTGMMGVEHIMNLNAIDGTTVVAVADPHEPSVHEARSIIPNEIEAFRSAEDLVAADLCDAVVIATPNMTHKAILDTVLASDLHVLVEKPLCTTVADCEDVVEAANSRDAITWVGLEYRYMAPVARLIEEVHSGTVGTLHMVALREHRFPFLPKVADWNRLSENTGGTLVEKCCHYFDLMTVIADARPTSVFASGGQSVNHLDEIYDGRRSDILDNAYVIVEFDNGVRGMLDLCMFADATRNQEELVAVGDTGKVESLIPEHVIRIGRRGEHWIGEVEEHPVHHSDVPYMGHHHGSSYLEHVDFAEAIRTGGQAKVSIEDGLLSVAVGAAAHRSIDERRPVDIAEMFR